jgi:hypothetical protein
MDLYKINIKLPAQDSDVDDAVIVPVFHRWIQNQSLADHLLIDVADYDHVHNGPGVVLIASEANLHFDHGQGQLGLLYVRKRPIPDAPTLAERLRFVLAATLEAAAKLQREPELAGRLRFSPDELWIQSNDRLAAPNTDGGFEMLRSAIAALPPGLGWQAAAVERVVNSAQELLKIRISVPALL